MQLTFPSGATHPEGLAMPDQNLQARTILLTGTTGIGRSTAELLAAPGATVIPGRREPGPERAGRSRDPDGPP